MSSGNTNATEKTVARKMQTYPEVLVGATVTEIEMPGKISSCVILSSEPLDVSLGQDYITNNATEPSRDKKALMNKHFGSTGTFPNGFPFAQQEEFSKIYLRSAVNTTVYIIPGEAVT
jgi:hypothetical protein